MDRNQPNTEARPPEQDEVALFALNVWLYKQGQLVSLMIHLGQRLGLYAALDGMGAVSASELAGKTGLSARWLLEWLKGQAAAKLLAYHPDDRFELTSTARAVLVDEQDSLFFAGGAFDAPYTPEHIEGLLQAFKSGLGMTYEALGHEAACATERSLGPWTRLALVPKVIPALDGVAERLRAGATVVDVGCGAGVAVNAIAAAFPNCQVHGYDPSNHAIAIARQRATEAGLENATFHVKGGEELPPDQSVDFALTLDCVHDLPHPTRVISAIHSALKPDGTWLIKDIRSRPRFEDNLRNPVLAMMYGFSITSCMSSALSEPGGAGLGTLGFNPEVAREMTTSAGFTRFEEHDFDDPANLYYEVRK